MTLLYKGIKEIETRGVIFGCTIGFYEMNNVMVGTMGVRQIVEYSTEQDPTPQVVNPCKVVFVDIRNVDVGL